MTPDRRLLDAVSRMFNHADENEHELPADDIFVHWDTASCWCNPEFDPDSGLVVHNRVKDRPV